MIRISCAGLAAVLGLAARCGLAGLVTERVQVAAKDGLNAAAKIVAVVAGMVAGADSINDMPQTRIWLDRTRLDGTEGARIWTGHGILAHNLIKIGTLVRLAGPETKIKTARSASFQPLPPDPRLLQVEVATQPGPVWVHRSCWWLWSSVASSARSVVPSLTQAR
jgi:hypothetical protein